jgi:hypothetical protein
MIAGRIHHEEHEGHEEYSFVPSWLSSLLLQGVALTKPPSGVNPYDWTNERGNH